LSYERMLVSWSPPAGSSHPEGILVATPREVRNMAY